MRHTFALALLLLAASAARAACIPFEEAAKRVGDTVCVTGKVLKVAQSQGGTTFLDFCEDYRRCPFTVVIFASNLRDVGDVRQLEGKVIQIHGRIQMYGPRAEIILKNTRQLKGEAAKIPPLPKTYDVEKRGGFSAGEAPHKGKK